MSTKYIYTRLPSDDMLFEAAEFFSEHYGVWGESAVENMGGSIKAGARVKISPKLLREKILPEGSNNIYIRLVREREILGVLFATRWKYQPQQTIVWVTQLCVHRQHRHKGLAKNILRFLKTNMNYPVGILSSHPFSIAAVARVWGTGLQDINFQYMRAEAKKVMATCPVTYVREAKLRGNLFEDGEADGAICCADTQFWVDHQEPDIAHFLLKRNGISWPLGELPEGHEYLLMATVNDTKKEEVKEKEEIEGTQ
ncbi:hypothetical protein VTL71DRAFT_1446 [Oculimacula yallundae]|uniref:N-acetyltransferase domain-containing protein n=1 Tax=Oculimacula yallundae TaxID=86028 RepID=A0ABR4CBV9_9HELO